MGVITAELETRPKAEGRWRARGLLPRGTPSLVLWHTWCWPKLRARSRGKWGHGVARPAGRRPLSPGSVSLWREGPSWVPGTRGIGGTRLRPSRRPTVRKPLWHQRKHLDSEIQIITDFLPRI